MRLLSIAILSAALMFSCNSEPEQQGTLFAQELHSVFEISEINDKVVGEQQASTAPGAWVSALRLSAYANRFQRVDYCLLIKAPLGLEPGGIKFVVAQSFDKKCSDSIFSKNQSEELEFYNLKIELGEADLKIKLDQNELRYHFSNIERSSLLVSTPGNFSKPDTTVLKNGEICQSVADDCSTTEDRCDLCEEGSYPLKNSACVHGYSRVCGEDKCGEKGQPACIRGQMSTGIKDYCIQDSPVGFCVGKARVACVNGTLVCE